MSRLKVISPINYRRIKYVDICMKIYCNIQSEFIKKCKIVGYFHLSLIKLVRVTSLKCYR